MVASQEHKLQDVMVTCPVAQLPLATGVQLSAAVFATAVFANVRVQCPHCEGEHRWNKADAFLTEIKRGAMLPAERGASPALWRSARHRPPAR